MPNQVSECIPTSSASAARSTFDVEKVSPFLLAVLLAYAGFRSICEAAITPLWYDELCTFIMVRQKRISVMWSALKQGADVQPPGFYLAERLSTAVITNERVAFRSLSIIAFLFTALCLFILIRKRRGNAVALLCAAIPLLTVLYGNLAIEARPYALVAGCVSFALVCYQRTPAIRWMILLGLSLALAQSFHYYAAIAFFPFVVSETVFVLSERKVRWLVWLSLGFGLLPLLVFWPLLSKSRDVYGQHFWSKPSLAQAQTSYTWFLNSSDLVGVAVTAGSAIAVLATALYMIRWGTQSESTDEAMLQEPILILAFLSLPFVAFIATTVAHGGMNSKYVISTIIGFPLALGYSLPRAGGKWLVLACIGIFLVMLSRQERQFWSTYNAHFSSPAELAQDLAGLAGHEDLPVVVSDPHEFMLIEHYASPTWTARFVSVVDAPQAVLYTGTDVADKELPILASYFPIHVYDFQSFKTEHPMFLLYSNNGGAGEDWWPRKLAKDGYTLRPVAFKPKSEHDFYHRVFLVTRAKEAD